MAMVSDFLHKVTLFQDLDGPTLATLTSLLALKKIKAEDTIFREMDTSDALYVVERGRVVVSKHVHGDVDIVITRFHPGDFFGEMGLFDAGPRSASAQAEIDTLVWLLRRDAFHQIMSDHADIGAKICYRLVGVFIQRPPRRTVLEQGGDVLEQDAFAREILDVADFCAQIGDVHAPHTS